MIRIEDVWVRERLDGDECVEQQIFRGRRSDREALFRAIEGGGHAEWKRWRGRNGPPKLAGLEAPGMKLVGFDLSDAILTGADLRRTDLRGADLSGARLRRARLGHAVLAGSKCTRTDFSGADMFHCDLSAARCHKARFLSSRDYAYTDLTNATLARAELHGAKLRGARLHAAALHGAELLDADLRDAILDEATFCWTSMGGANLDGASAMWALLSHVAIDARTRHSNLVVPNEITPARRGARHLVSRRADDIRVASFIGLMSAQAIDQFRAAASRSVVLILGSFSEERIAVLRTIEDELSRRGLVPIVYDFDSDTEDELIDTVRMTAGVSRYVIADLTESGSVPFELGCIVPHLSVPVIPILQKGAKPFAMFNDLHRKYPWVLRPRTYVDTAQLMQKFERAIVQPAKRMRRALRARRRKAGHPISVRAIP